MLRKVIKTATIYSYNKYLLISTNQFHTTQTHRVEQESAATERRTTNRVNDFMGKLSKEEQEKILKRVNNYQLKELLSYDISKARANKLISWRMRNGLLKNLNDIFSIEGFGFKVSEKFYQSLLQEPKEQDIDLAKGGKSRTAPFVTPTLEAEQQTRIKSCVAVRIGVNSVTWARLEVPGKDINAPCLLTHWQHHEISEKKLHINDLIQRCIYVDHMIPEADCYIFENPQMAQASNNPGSVEQQNINIQKAQVTAVMGYALASRNSFVKDIEENDSGKKSQYCPTVFYLRRFLTARLFNHLVGTERVSSEETILNMMRTYYNSDETNDYLVEHDDADSLSTNSPQALETGSKFSGNVQFPSELRQMFSQAPRVYREFLGQSLLLNLTFVRLVLLQDSESIAVVTRGNKTKPALSD